MRHPSGRVSGAATADNRADGNKSCVRNLKPACPPSCPPTRPRARERDTVQLLPQLLSFIVAPSYVMATCRQRLQLFWRFGREDEMLLLPSVPRLLFSVCGSVPWHCLHGTAEAQNNLCSSEDFLNAITLLLS